MRGAEVSHLFLANDCLLFVKTTCAQVRLVKEVLGLFCKASGLKVNAQKFIFYAFSNLKRQEITKFASILQFYHTTNLGKSLEFPMLKLRVWNMDFSHIIDRVNNRLAGWKSKLLNRAGKMTLAKLVLFFIPTYLWIPEGICNHIDAVVRNFIWINLLHIR